MDKLQGYKINNQFFETPLDFNGVKLIQAGRYFCEPNTVIRPHLHSDFYELTIVTDGKGVVSANGYDTEVKKNDVFVSFPFDRHGIISSATEPLQYDHLAFIVEHPEYKKALQEVATEYYDARMRVVQDNRINYLTYCVLGEFDHERPYTQDMVRHTLLNIIVYLVRRFKKKNVKKFDEHASQAEMFCNRIMNYIDTNIYSLENLQDLTQITNYNYNYISTVFKKTTNTNLRDYFVTRKLEVADMLLKEGKLRVHEIAEKLHYSSGNALTKAYKQKYGVAPTHSL